MLALLDLLPEISEGIENFVHMILQFNVVTIGLYSLYIGYFMYALFFLIRDINGGTSTKPTEKSQAHEMMNETRGKGRRLGS